MYKSQIYLKYFRERAGLTRAELAVMTGYSVYDIICIEKGTLKPDLENVQRLAQACKTTTDEMLGYQPDKPKEDLFPNSANLTESEKSANG